MNLTFNEQQYKEITNRRAAEEAFLNATILFNGKQYKTTDFFYKVVEGSSLELYANNVTYYAFENNKMIPLPEAFRHYFSIFECGLTNRNDYGKIGDTMYASNLIYELKLQKLFNLYYYKMYELFRSGKANHLLFELTGEKAEELTVRFDGFNQVEVIGKNTKLNFNPFEILPEMISPRIYVDFVELSENSKDKSYKIYDFMIQNFGKSYEKDLMTFRELQKKQTENLQNLYKQAMRKTIIQKDEPPALK